MNLLPTYVIMKILYNDTLIRLIDDEEQIDISNEERYHSYPPTLRSDIGNYKLNHCKHYNSNNVNK